MVDHGTPMKCFVSNDRRNRKPKQSNANASFVKPAPKFLDQRCKAECCHQSLSLSENPYHRFERQICAMYTIDC